MRPLQNILLINARFWCKIRRRLRRYYLSCVLGAMGKDCSVSDGVIITDPEYTFIGNRVSINEGVILLTFNNDSTISIGNDVTISYGVNVITGGLNIYNGLNRNKHIVAPVVIEDNTWIGAKVIILSGVTIGKGSVVAAGSVVNQDVPPNSLVAGVPAKVVKTLAMEEQE